MQDSHNILFLSIGNSARSIMAEAIMNLKGKPKFTAYSAGSHPTGRIHPQTIKQLQSVQIPTAGLRSKSWDEFAKPGAPELHFIFKFYDDAAEENCPAWPGQPMTAHWNYPDPAAVEGTPEEIERAFKQTFLALELRINLFLSLPPATVDNLAFQGFLEKIAH